MRPVSETPDAAVWLESKVNHRATEGRFGEVKGSVIWSSAKGTDGNFIIDIDPHALLEEIKLGQFPVLLRHDPGHPLGKILDAEFFIARTGEQFIAAVIGLYAGRRISFADLAIDASVQYESPIQLPELASDYWIKIAVDPREVSEDWLKAVVANAELPIRATAASNNAKKSHNELIRVGVLFVTLVWNPIVSTVGTEAGKDIYKAAKNTLEALADRMSDLANPILEIQSFHGGCQISFILRGARRQTNRDAMSKISAAAVQAEHLVAKMKAQSKPPKILVYEYDRSADMWFPSYAELTDGSFVTDNEKLYAAQELPDGLSLGLTSIRNRP